MKRKTKIAISLLILYWGLAIVPNWINEFSVDLYKTSFKFLDSLLRFGVLVLILNIRRWNTHMLITIFLTMAFAGVDVMYKIVGFWYKPPKDYWYWIGISAFIAVILYARRKKFSFDLAKTVPYDPDALTLLAYRAPKRLIEVIPCIFRLSPYGSFKIITKGQEFGFDKETGKMGTKPFVNNGKWKFSKCEKEQDKIWLLLGRYAEIMENRPKFKGFKRFFVKSKADYHLIFNNCFQFEIAVKEEYDLTKLENILLKKWYHE